MNFLIMIKKEYLQLLRDLVVVAFMFYLFIPDVIIAGKGLGIKLINAKFSFMDMSKTPESRELLSKMVEPYFNISMEVESWKALNSWIKRGDTSGAFIIPSEFLKDISRKRQTKILLILDGSLISTAMLAYAYSQSIVSDYNQWILKNIYHIPFTASYPYVRAKTRIEFNPNLESQYFGGLSELFTNVTMMTIILAALSFVREKDYGTIEQILISPVKFYKFALAKICFISSCMLILIILSLTVSVKAVLGTPIRGSIPLFLFLSLLVVLADTGIGLIIGGLSEKISQVGLLTILFLAPMLFLSGGWVPPESMPKWLYPLTNFSPLKYYLELGLGIILKGTSLKEIWMDITKCAMLSLGMLVLGYVLLKKRLFEGR